MRAPLLRRLALLAIGLGTATVADAAQLRVAPGPLSRAHAALEGVGNCGSCHDAGQALSAARCLSCHKPIAERITQKRGVHRAVTDDCSPCHAEHAGTQADLRRFDTRAFDHAVETGFALEGRHANTASNCAACHKARTFLGARTTCDSCHTDVHKGTLGHECTRCHSTAVPFKQTRGQFDHGRARFELTGAHRTVACEKCHAAGVFRGLPFDTCTPCHREPHRRTLGPSCSACHVTDRWTTRVIDHARTGFALAGAHGQVACAGCHQSGVTRALRFDQCSACHADVHRGSVREDCGKCHTETSFRGASFDHGSRTAFPLAGRHGGLACRRCHTMISTEQVPMAQRVVDFGGANAECVACHKDQHKAEYGRACDACHRPETFKVAGFVHRRSPEFFAGRHAGMACARCHVRAGAVPPEGPGKPAVSRRAAAPAMLCGACHADVHLGQVGPACERCHTVAAARFAAARFSHEAGAFPLTGKHGALDCAKCHATETATFPAGPGTARRLKPVSAECRACHKDPHLGQADVRCAACHSTASFRLLSYRHRGLEDLFGVGSHAKLPCRSCHKTETGQFPAGRGTAIRFKPGRTCLECHP